MRPPALAAELVLVAELEALGDTGPVSAEGMRRHEQCLVFPVERADTKNNSCSLQIHVYIGESCIDIPLAGPPA